ncbi:MAG: hypothetical protein ACFB02_13190 [Mastigocoleus sp.]
MTFKFTTHNIYLFAYYMSERVDSLGEYQHDWLWEKCDQIVSKALKTEFQFHIKKHLDLKNKPEEPWANLNKNFPKTDNYYPIYVQPHGFCFNKYDSKIDSNSKTSIIYPVQLYNNYGFGLKLIFPKNQNGKNIESKDIAKANPNNCLILDPSRENKYFLGQTLLITINLEGIYKLKNKYNQEKLKNIADNYLESLLPSDFRKPAFNRSGYLFGSPIYEYGIIRASKTYNHIIVWFFSDELAEEKFEHYYQQILDLFFFRAKIIHAYRQIKKIEKQAKNKSKEIQAEIESTQHFFQINRRKKSQKETNEVDLNKLQNLLMRMPHFSVEYAENIRFIKEFQNIIVDDTRNYTDKIYEIKSNNLDEDLSFLELFIERTCRPFQERVTAAVNFFQLDINLIDNAIDSIRGQVAIEQTHRERQLQNAITSLGIGIAVAGNFASSYEAGSIAENKKPEKNDPQNIPINLPFIEKPINLTFHTPHFLFSFITSMLIGFLVWQAASWFFSWWYGEEQLIRKKRLSLNLFRFLQKK